jgi:GntR family transcriptional regulator, phosphonate transport system regulatory protein
VTRVPTVEWQSLALKIRADIEAGRYPVGSQLPSEPALMKEFGGGRHSLRRALNELAVAGLIRTEHGRGSFVQSADVLDYKISLRTRASTSVGEQGRASTDQPVLEEVQPASRHVAEALQIEAGSLVYMIVRHGFADDMPICVTTAYHPVDRFPDIDKARRSLRRLTEIYASYGVNDYFRLKTTISTRMPTAEVMRILRLAPQQPVLVTHKVDADTNGVPIAYSEAIWAGNRIQFTIDNSLEISQMTAKSDMQAAAE